MSLTLYAIQRRIPRNFVDWLLCPWEGDDLPTFVGASRRYLFDAAGDANRVLGRLQARYPKTFETPEFPALPIEYRVIPVRFRKVSLEEITQ